MAVFSRGSPKAVKDNEVPAPFRGAFGHRENTFSAYAQRSKHGARWTGFFGKGFLKTEKGFHAEFYQFGNKIP
jgi:hypothetical protein